MSALAAWAVTKSCVVEASQRASFPVCGISFVFLFLLLATAFSPFPRIGPEHRFFGLWFLLVDVICSPPKDPSLSHNRGPSRRFSTAPNPPNPQGPRRPACHIGLQGVDPIGGP